MRNLNPKKRRNYAKCIGVNRSATYMVSGWYNLHGQWLVQHTGSVVGTTYMVNGWYNLHGHYLVQHTWSMAGTTHMMKSKMASNRMIYATQRYWSMVLFATFSDDGMLAGDV